MICEQCGKEVKSLSRHVWKAHGKGMDHKPFTGKTQVPWNRGLTADSDPRVAAFGEKMKGRANVGHPHGEATKSKIATAMRGNRNANHRGKKTVYRDVKMDSSWEAAVAAYLDRQGLSWRYGEEVFLLDERRSYRPDFILGCGKVIEVKGYWRSANRLKFDEWTRKYPDIEYEVWDKERLLSLGLIDRSGRPLGL